MAYPPGGAGGEYFSASYMWCSKDRLGQGATGQVFVGYHKRSGDKVAIKMFTRASEFRAMQTEMHTIKELTPHPNIVQFLTIDEMEKSTHANIIVMELCDGGSLYEVIDSPMNAMGLDEYQFQRVIFDVASGMRHLRQNGFVHRDVKPGNIMRTVRPNGSYVFKLADFGTARKLAPDEHFTSLHGTEEYLYPAMYERALINMRSQEEFVDKVDLWSVGATFFHLATGRLPFKPYRKREDRQTMYKIITEKKSGVILGWQLEPNSPIYYSKTLPGDIVLSEGLRTIVTPILAGLMDNFENMWDFDKFFQEIEKVNRMKVVHVFCVSRCTHHRIYIDPDVSNVIPKLKELISQQTTLHPQYMEFYFENIPLNTNEPMTTRQLPMTTTDSPLTVFGGPPQKPDGLVTPVLPQPPTMPHETSIVDDLRYAKDCSRSIWAIYRAAETLELYFRLMNQAALCLREKLDKDYQAWCRKFDEVRQLFKSLIDLSECHISSLNSDIEFLQAVNPMYNNSFDADISELRSELKEKHIVLTEVTDRQYSLQQQTEDFHSLVFEICNPSSWDVNYSAEVFDGSIKTMKTYVDKVDELFQVFQEEKKHRAGLQSHYDKKAHEHNKRTVKERLKDAENKLIAMTTGRSNVYQRLYAFLERCAPLREDLANFMVSLKVSSQSISHEFTKLQNWFPKHQQRMQQLMKRLSSERSTGPASSSPSADSSYSEQVVIPQIKKSLYRFRENTEALHKLLKDQETILKM